MAVGTGLLLLHNEFRKSAWAACIKRIYEIDPLECPKCKAQMRIIAFIQDEHSRSIGRGLLLFHYLACSLVFFW